MTAAIEFRAVSRVYRRGARGRRRVVHDRARRVLRHARAVGLGQDHLPAAGRGLRRAGSRAGAARRAGRLARPALRAQRQHGVPGLRAVPAHDGAGERGVRAARARRRAWPSAPRARAKCSSSCSSRALGERRPAQLSGGQRQRVALARALINQPKVLLLDEPLGALDLKLREEMQIELKSLQKKLGITFVYVTHDQGEALSMADRVAVFNKGRIEQLAAPRELYTRPTTAFVARFVGSANVANAALARSSSVHGAQPFADSRREHRAAARRAAAVPAGAVTRRGRGGRRAVSRRREPLAGAARRRRGVERAGHRRGVARAATGSTSARASNYPGRATRPCRWRTRCDALRAASTFFYRRPYWYLALLLVPPLLWFGTVYLGSLFALLWQSFYRIDDFTAQIVREPTLATYKQLVTQPANLDIVVRTVTMAIAVTIACAIDRAAHRHLHGALRARPHEGVLLRRRDAADVDQLPRQGLRLAPAAREGGHRRLVRRQARAHGRARSAAARRPASAAPRCPRRISACSSCSSTCGCRS